MDDVTAYYDQDGEDERLLVGSGPLEFERIKRLLARFLEPASRVADIGGGTGRYAEWLVEGGHTVELVDPMPLHVERARARAAGRFTARVGEARELPFEDGAFDAVLLLGPLYHLERRDERVAALVEAARVCRPGGLVAATAISRLAPLLGTVRSGTIFDPAVLVNVRDEGRGGTRVPPERRTGLFPRAYFHLPEELREEMHAARLESRGLFGVQGPAWLCDEFVARWDDPASRERILEIAAELEQDQHVVALSPHLLAVAAKPA